MSNKFQRPSGVFLGDTDLSNRTKYQDDAAAVPRVAISSAKIDGDFNYVVQALNTIDAASGERASIDDRLSVSINADGTLKGSVVATLDDWVALEAGFTRVSDTVFTVDSNVVALFTLGRRVQLIVAGVTVYSDVLTAEFTSGLTTVTLVDAVILSAPSAVRYAPVVAGIEGSGQSVFGAIEVRGEAPLVRVAKTSGGDFALRENSGALVISENIGTEIAPVWSDRVVVSSDGIQLEDTSISAVKLAKEGNAGDVLTAQASGAPIYMPAVPSGSVIPFAGSAAPEGYLMCDGAAISRGTYVNLFTALGEIYGAGDSITTFNVPDLRGRSVFGANGSAAVLSEGALGDFGGTETKDTEEHVLTVEQIPAHTHGLSASVGKDSDSKGGADGLQQGGSSETESIGGGLGHSHAINVMPPHLVMNYIIKT